VLGGFVWAGTTGKISGKVSDARTKEALIGVNVVIEGTVLGAATDLDGNYMILNIPPGSYSVKASAVGYGGVTKTEVRVSIDLTTTLDFELSEVAIQAQEVVVVAERPLVQKDLTASTAIVNADQIKALPVTEFTQILSLQAGYMDGHLRGGRAGEISYWIDGVPVTDVYDKSLVIEVNKNLIQELQVISGAYNAEYGQAMSGIVNIATKEGGDKFGGSATTYAGDYASTHDGVFQGLGLKRFNPTRIRNFEGSLDGPILKDRLTFFANARYIYFTGYNYGVRKFNPGAVPVVVNGELYILGTDPVKDSIANFNALTPEKRVSPDTISRYYNLLRQNHTGGLGDGEYVPMSWSERLYLQGKLALRITPSMKLSYNFILQNDNSKPYWWQWQYNPDGVGTDYKRSYTNILELTHTLGSSTFYTLGVSYFSNGFKHYLYEDPNDPRYVHPSLTAQLTQFSFYTSGTDLGRFDRNTATFLSKFDITSQVTDKHQVKAGIEFRQHKLDFETITLQPVSGQTSIDPIWNSPYINTQILDETTTYHDSYTRKPYEFSGYVQDKMEFRDFILNVGVRFDFFEPNGDVLVDASDPDIYNPIKPQNRFHDLNGNGVQDTGEPDVTLAERQAYWYTSASSKFQVSPRIGASFPITDRGVIHFSYGHFFQIPQFQYLYENPHFKVGQGTGNLGRVGNADLSAEETINGEIGVQQQLTDDISIDVTAYLRDIRDLTGTREDKIYVFGGYGYYTKYVNSDFGFVRGIIVSMNKRFSNGFGATLDYNFQVAKGSASDPTETAAAVSGGAMPEVQLVSLGWDQRHTLNATVSYNASTWGGSIVAKYGSGQPYTPRRTVDISSLISNSQIKPTFFTADLTAYKQFSLGWTNLVVFGRVINIFDIENETGVFDDTGRAGFTTDTERIRSLNTPTYVNTIEEWFSRPYFYSEPRRIEFGVTLEF
jgi:outer membrane receptor for ferrienterochelin and colicin